MVRAKNISAMQVLHNIAIAKYFRDGCSDACVGKGLRTENFRTARFRENGRNFLYTGRIDPIPKATDQGLVDLQLSCFEFPQMSTVE